MKISGVKLDVFLRDLIRDDLADYERWHTRETRWAQWDAPWEPVREPETVLQQKEDLLGRTLPQPRKRMEICSSSGTHLGGVSTYQSKDEPQGCYVGIDLAESGFWNRGLGTQALQLWLAYLFFEAGNDVLFCATWSGNLRMIRLAEKCGFCESSRIENLRKVRGEVYDKVVFRLSRDKFLAGDPPSFEIDGAQFSE